VAKAAEDFDQQSPAERHHLRIAVKNLRYTAELLGGLYDAAVVRRFTEPLRRLQDDLGNANDLEVAQQIVARLAGYGKAGGRIAEAGQLLLDWHRHQRAKREGKTHKHLDRLLLAEPFWRG
jgi:CHAD domain-containing protein